MALVRRNLSFRSAIAITRLSSKVLQNHSRGQLQLNNVE